MEIARLYRDYLLYLTPAPLPVPSFFGGEGRKNPKSETPPLPGLVRERGSGGEGEKGEVLTLLRRGGALYRKPPSFAPLSHGYRFAL